MGKTEEPLKAIVEVRKAVMVSPGGAKPTFRVAHFLKPSLSTSEETFLDPLLRSLFSVTTATKPKEIPLQVILEGWLSPQVEWKIWVESLRPKFETLWRKVGIFEAIMSSTYSILRDSDLILKLGERWCTETSSFVFPWGEATITLEDMMICGGYSVLGSPVVKPLHSEELKEIYAKLDQVRRMLIKTKAKKASHLPWIRFFMENKSQVEHEAFLSLWLSRFVLTNHAKGNISCNVFPIAIHLARGKRIALAPAVLANIYRDLSLLEVKIRASIEPVCRNGDEGIKKIVLWGPFQLLQIWVFERFPALQPQPLFIKYGEPRIARWHKRNKRKNDDHADVRLALDSAGSSFNWRPYTVDILNGKNFKFYSDKEIQLQSQSDSDEELISFAYCLRPSELVSLDCIELYLPHRVAMQFGFDQDLPGWVGRCDRSPSIAWNNYNRSVIGAEIYLASTTYKPTVTSGYLKWWEKLKVGTAKAGKDRSLSGNTCSTSKRSSHYSGCSGNRDNAGNSNDDHKKFNAYIVSDDCIPHTIEKTKVELEGAQDAGSNSKVRGFYDEEVVNVDDDVEDCIPHKLEKTTVKFDGAQDAGSNNKVRGFYDEEVVNVDDDVEDCIPHRLEKMTVEFEGAQDDGSNKQVRGFYDEEVVNVDDDVEDCIPHRLKKMTVEFEGAQDADSNNKVRGFYDEEVVNVDDDVEDFIPHRLEKTAVEFEGAEDVDSSKKMRGFCNKEVLNVDDNGEDCIPSTLEKTTIEFEGARDDCSNNEVRSSDNDEDANMDDESEECILEKMRVEFEARLTKLERSVAKFEAAYF